MKSKLTYILLAVASGLMTGLNLAAAFEGAKVTANALDAAFPGKKKDDPQKDYYVLTERGKNDLEKLWDIHHEELKEVTIDAVEEPAK